MHDICNRARASMDAPRETRALLVSYAFPPVGGAGVQRVTKLVKYLPLHGVRPAVLAALDPSVPVRDDSLSRDVPATVHVERARTLEPGYGAKRAAWKAETATASFRTRAVRALAAVARQALFPDSQVLWQPAAQRVLALRIARRADDVVLVSGPPFSQFLLAPLARAGGLGVVLDYRDEWRTLRTTYEMGKSLVARALGDPLEGALLRAAHAVVASTGEMRAALLEGFPRLDPGRVFVVPNGYDPDDFPESLPAPPRDRFVVTYAGTVFALTSARGLLGAVCRLHERTPRLAAAMTVRFLGRIVDTELAAFAGVPGVERTGYVAHDEVLGRLSASHMTVCILDDVAGADRVYPAKIFELMRLGRPVLVLAPRPSALAHLVERHGLGPVVHPRDEEAIASVLQGALEAFQRGDADGYTWRNASSLSRYDRRALAGEFAEILRDAAAHAGRRGS